MPSKVVPVRAVHTPRPALSIRVALLISLAASVACSLGDDMKNLLTAKDVTEEANIFEAEATVLLGFALSGGDTEKRREVAETYRLQITARPFLESVLDEGQLPLDADGLGSMISATTDVEPLAIRISIMHSVPETVAFVAQTVGRGVHRLRDRRAPAKVG